MPEPTTTPQAAPTPEQISAADWATDRAIILGRIAAAIQKIDAGRARVEELARWLPGDSGAMVRPLLDGLRAKLTQAVADIQSAPTYDAMIQKYRTLIADLLNAQGTVATALAGQIAVPGLRYSRQLGIAVGEGIKALGTLAAEVAGGAAEGLGLGTIALIGVGLFALSRMDSGRAPSQG